MCGDWINTTRKLGILSVATVLNVRVAACFFHSIFKAYAYFKWAPTFYFTPDFSFSSTNMLVVVNRTHRWSLWALRFVQASHGFALFHWLYLGRLCHSCSSSHGSQQALGIPLSQSLQKSQNQAVLTSAYSNVNFLHWELFCITNEHHHWLSCKCKLFHKRT